MQWTRHCSPHCCGCCCLLTGKWDGGHIAARLCASRCRLADLCRPAAARIVLLWRCQRQRKKIRLAKIVKISHQQISLPKSVNRCLLWILGSAKYCWNLYRVLITIRIKRRIVKIRVTPAWCQPATPHCGTIVNLTIHEILWQKNCHLHISSDVLITKHLVLFFCQN